MKTVNILDELRKDLKQRRTKLSENPVINEVNRLLEYDTSRDNAVMDMIGPRSSLSQSKNEQAALIELEKEENFYGGEVFTKEQIIDLAVKYRLKFLPSEIYTAYLDPKIVLDIRELERNISKSMMKQGADRKDMTVDEYVAQEGKIEHKLDESKLKHKFYILAPASCFATVKESQYNVHVPDPILFYKTDDVHFKVVRKWGTDFTVSRRVKGFLTKNENIHRLFMYTLPLVALIVTFSAIFSWWGICSLPLTLLTQFAGDYRETFFGREYVSSHESYWI